MRTSRARYCWHLAALAAIGLTAAALLFQVWKPEPADTEVLVTSLPQRISGFCGDCHAVPSPDTFPASAWDHEVRQGYDFYSDSGRIDLDVPPIQEVIAWYRDQAPVTLSVPVPTSSGEPSPVRFRSFPVPFPSEQQFTAVSNIHWVEPAGGNSGQLLFCDMNSGDVGRVFVADGMRMELLARLSHPAHIEVTDLDGDQRPDFVVAELGSLMPDDHSNGKVIWLYQPDGGEEWQTAILQEGLGRVADVRPGDFNGNGKIDLVVADLAGGKPAAFCCWSKQDPRRACRYSPCGYWMSGMGLSTFQRLISTVTAIWISLL